MSEWNRAIDAAAKVADDYDHHGDPGEAMYAGVRIRARIRSLKRPDATPDPLVSTLVEALREARKSIVPSVRNSALGGDWESSGQNILAQIDAAIAAAEGNGGKS